MTSAITELTSRQNPLLKRIRLLSGGPFKKFEDVVLAEGTRVLEEVLKSGHGIEAVVLSDRFGLDTRERSLLSNWIRHGIRMYRVGENLFQTISCLHTVQGAIALVKVPGTGFPPKKHRNALILYACGIQDPGNLGTLVRTAAASGTTLFCTSPGTVSARNPKAVRASAGAFFHKTPAEHIPPETVLSYCRNRSMHIYRTDTRKGVPYTEADLSSPCAILLGNEGSGMREKVFNELPAIRIPLANRIESLNVALAGAVILFEAARQRSL